MSNQSNPKSTICPTCDGTGKVFLEPTEQEGWDWCLKCHGSGSIPAVQPEIKFTRCPTCNNAAWQTDGCHDPFHADPTPSKAESGEKPEDELIERIKTITATLAHDVAADAHETGKYKLSHLTAAQARLVTLAKAHRGITEPPEPRSAASDAAKPANPTPPQSEIEPRVSSWDFPADLLEAAWGLIANSYGGYWDKATEDWIEAAIRWREAYFATLPHADSSKVSEEPLSSGSLGEETKS